MGSWTPDIATGCDTKTNMTRHGTSIVSNHLLFLNKSSEKIHIKPQRIEMRTITIASENHILNNECG
jgi:coenzyme F420-reducing hydrogenase delta subunit